MTSQLESCLNELDNILNSLISSNFYFEYSMIYNPIVTDKEFKSKASLETIDPLIDILFESMVIQLYKLFEIQPILTKCLANLNKIELLKILRKPWSHIQQSRNKITIWRNKIISHSREQSSNYLSYNLLDPTYNKSRKMIITVSRFAVIYIWAIINNIHDEYMNATFMKEENKNSLIRVDAIEALSQAINDEKKFWNEVNIELRQKGYRLVSFCGYEEWPMKMVDMPPYAIDEKSYYSSSDNTTSGRHHHE